MIGKLLLLLLAVLAALLLAALVRTLLVKPKTADYSAPAAPERAAAYAEKLSRMVRCETVSSRAAPQTEKFRAFHGVLRELFPRTFAACEYTDLEGCLVLRWKGRTAEKPVMFLSHMDVVEASTPEAWKYPPFSGTVADGRVWGRGAADTKCSLFCFLQCAEELIGEGFVPERDIYLASGCTEEIGGDGAPRIARWLKANGIRLEMLCDEGGSLARDPMKGVAGVYAMVGLFEKGYGDVRLTASGRGGHSSAPPKGTPIPQLARFICRVERRSPFRSRFCPELDAMLARMAPYCPFGLRYLLSNLWLFRPLLRRALRDTKAGAMLRTTICFTMQKGSEGTNVIPQQASVVANLRFIPHQGREESLRLLRELAGRYGLGMEIITASDPTRSVDIHGRPFALTERTIEKCFPGAGVIPYIVTGGTDCRFFGEVCDNTIRFSPVLYGPEALSAMHGVNEHVDCDTLPGGVDYYKTVARSVGEL